MDIIGTIILGLVGVSLFFFIVHSAYSFGCMVGYGEAEENLINEFTPKIENLRNKIDKQNEELEKQKKQISLLKCGILEYEVKVIE